MTSGKVSSPSTPAPDQPARAAPWSAATSPLARIIGFAPAAVIFDLDGVLADTEPINQRALEAVLAKRGVTISDGDFVDMIGLSNEATWERLIDRLGLTDTASSLTNAYVKALVPLLSNLVAAPGAAELVSALHDSGVGLAVASSSPRAAIEAVLRAIGLHRSFQAVVSDEDVQAGKPAPDIFLLAARRLGAEPATCVVIEDSAHGVEAARRAGMAWIALETRYNRELQLPGRRISSLTKLLRRTASSS